MAVIRFSVEIRAPPRRCFDLARSVDFHLASTPGTGETAVAGMRTGLLAAGDEVTWRARHFGMWQELTSRITKWSPPALFRDSQVRGPFQRFDHDHYFDVSLEYPPGTIMTEVFDFDAPFGVLGRCAEELFLTGYMRRFLVRRAKLLKRALETEDWRRYLPPADGAVP